MGPFGAWLNFTVYEEGILFVFLLRPPGGIFHICCIFYIFTFLWSPRKYIFYLFLGWPPRKDVFIHFQAGFPCGYFFIISYFYIYLDKIKYLLFRSYPLCVEGNWRAMRKDLGGIVTEDIRQL
jgi:hypothetical protein